MAKRNPNEHYSGPNAIRVLREIGVFEEVLSSSGEACLDRKSFVFRSGMGEHEVIYDVGVILSLWYTC